MEYTLETPSGPITVEAESDADAIRQASEMHTAAAGFTQTQPQTSPAAQGSTPGEETISPEMLPRSANVAPPGWKPATDPDGDLMRVFLNPNVTDADVDWTGVDASKVKTVPSNLFQMPGDSMKGGYLASKPSPGNWGDAVAPKETTPEEVHNQGRGEYWWKTAKNAPKSAVNAVTDTVDFFSDPLSQLATFGAYMSTDKEFRDNFMKHASQLLSQPGREKMFQDDPVGSIALVMGFMPTKFIRKFSKFGGKLNLEADIPEIPGSERTQGMKDVSGAAMDAAQRSGVYFKKDFVDGFRKSVEEKLDENFWEGDRIGDEALKEVLDKDIGFNGSWDFRHIQKINRKLNDVIGSALAPGSKNRNTAVVAIEIKNILKEYIEGVFTAKGQGLERTGDLTPEQAAKLYLEGRAGWAASEQTETLEGLADMAQIKAKTFSRGGMANSLNNEVKRVLIADAKSRRGKGPSTGLTKSQIKILKQFHFAQNVDEWMMRKITQHVGTLAGMGVGYLAGEGLGSTMMGGVAAVGATEGARFLGGKLAEKRFFQVIDMIRSDGEKRLINAVGKDAYDKVIGTKAGAKAVSDWRDSIGLTGHDAAKRALIAAFTTSSTVVPSELEKKLRELEDGLKNDQSDLPAQ